MSTKSNHHPLKLREKYNDRHIFTGYSVRLKSEGPDQEICLGTHDERWAETLLDRIETWRTENAPYLEMRRRVEALNAELDPTWVRERILALVKPDDLPFGSVARHAGGYREPKYTKQPTDKILNGRLTTAYLCLEQMSLMRLGRRKGKIPREVLDLASVSWFSVEGFTKWQAMLDPEAQGGLKPETVEKYIDVCRRFFCVEFEEYLSEQHIILPFEIDGIREYTWKRAEKRLFVPVTAEELEFCSGLAKDLIASQEPEGTMLVLATVGQCEPQDLRVITPAILVGTKLIYRDAKIDLRPNDAKWLSRRLSCLDLSKLNETVSNLIQLLRRGMPTRPQPLVTLSHIGFLHYDSCYKRFRSLEHSGRRAAAHVREFFGNVPVGPGPERYVDAIFTAIDHTLENECP